MIINEVEGEHILALATASATDRSCCKSILSRTLKNDDQGGKSKTQRKNRKTNRDGDIN